MKRCKRKGCREMNPDDAMFCQYCGYKFGRTKKIITGFIGFLFCITIIIAGYFIYKETTRPIGALRPQKQFSIPIPNNRTTRKAVIRFLPAPGNPCVLNYHVIETDSERNWALMDAEEAFSNFDSLGLLIREKILNKSIPAQNIAILCEPKDEEFVKKSLVSTLHANVKPINKAQNDSYLFSAIMPEVYQSNSCVVDIGRDQILFLWKEGRETVQLGCSKVTDMNTVNVELSRIISMIPEQYTDFFFVTGDFFLLLAKESPDFLSKTTNFVLLQEPDKYGYLKTDTHIANGLQLYQGIIDASLIKNFIFRKYTCMEIGYILGD